MAQSTILCIGMDAHPDAIQLPSRAAPRTGGGTCGAASAGASGTVWWYTGGARDACAVLLGQKRTRPMNHSNESSPMHH